jgi:hypothetical protein
MLLALTNGQVMDELTPVTFHQQNHELPPDLHNIVPLS